MRISNYIIRLHLCVAVLLGGCASHGDPGTEDARPGVDSVDRRIWFEAAEQGHSGLIRALLDEGVDPLIEHEGLTALHVAARQGDLDVVRVLVGAGVDVNLAPDLDESQLAAVAGHGSPQMIQLIVGRNVPADEVARAMSERTPLNLAVEAGHHEVAAYLLESGADVDLGGVWYRPLHTAVLNGDLEMVELLLDSRARVNESVRIHDRSSFAGFRYVRPLELARIIERDDITSLLREHGAR